MKRNPNGTIDIIDTYACKIREVSEEWFDGFIESYGLKNIFEIWYHGDWMEFFMNDGDHILFGLCHGTWRVDFHC